MSVEAFMRSLRVTDAQRKQLVLCAVRATVPSESQSHCWPGLMYGLPISHYELQRTMRELCASSRLLIMVRLRYVCYRTDDSADVAHGKDVCEQRKLDAPVYPSAPPECGKRTIELSRILII
jgi:hypothetical protein